MINPVHKIKKLAVFDDGRPSYWTEDTVVGWLSTGICDCNGREIFEGDILRFAVSKTETVDEVVRFIDSAFRVGEQLLLTELESLDIEAVGHVAEGEK